MSDRLNTLAICVCAIGAGISLATGCHIFALAFWAGWLALMSWSFERRFGRG